MTASFPDSVKEFTPKVDGVDVIAAADINSLQEEVVAIETQLIRGGGGGGWGDIAVNSDWSEPSNAVADIITSLGLGRPKASGSMLIVTLWEGVLDSGDYAWLGIGPSAPDDGYLARFDTPPASGTAKLIGAIYQTAS